MSQPLNSQLRLEVLATDDGNEVVNHSAQDGTATGWRNGSVFGTIGAATGLGAYGYDGHAFKMTSATEPQGAGNYNEPVLESEPVPVVGNEYVNVAATAYSADTHARRVSLSIVWYDASDQVIPVLSPVKQGSMPPGTELTMTLDNPTLGTLQAPSGTIRARVQISVEDSTNVKGEPGQVSYAYKVMVVTGSTLAEVTGPVFSDVPETWQNLLPKSVSHQIVRGGDVDGVTDRLELGSITSTLNDPASTPESNPRIRPGRPIRLVRASDGEPVITATINRASTAYGGDVPVVTINSGDAMAVTQKFPQVVGTSGTFKQRVDSALLNTPVDYVVLDTDPNTTTATISVEESGTSLSQLELARDTLRGLFYVGKDNTVRAFAANSYPSQVPTLVLSDSPLDVGAVAYLKRGIVTSYDTANVVNALLVNDVRAAAPKVYGPYTNQESVDAWGAVTAQVDINSGTPATVAGAYLAAYSEPTIFVESITFNATDDIATAIDRELYEAVRVKYAPAGLDATYRVIRIEHDITPKRWLVTLKFKPLESTTPITVTNPPGGANAGPSDLIP